MNICLKYQQFPPEKVAFLPGAEEALGGWWGCGTFAPAQLFAETQILEKIAVYNHYLIKAYWNLRRFGPCRAHVQVNKDLKGFFII